MRAPSEVPRLLHRPRRHEVSASGVPSVIVAGRDGERSTSAGRAATRSLEATEFSATLDHPGAEITHVAGRIPRGASGHGFRTPSDR